MYVAMSTAYTPLHGLCTERMHPGSPLLCLHLREPAHHDGMMVSEGISKESGRNSYPAAHDFYIAAGHSRSSSTTRLRKTLGNTMIQRRWQCLLGTAAPAHQRICLLRFVWRPRHPQASSPHISSGAQLVISLWFVPSLEQNWSLIYSSFCFFHRTPPPNCESASPLCSRVPTAIAVLARRRPHASAVDIEQATASAHRLPARKRLLVAVLLSG